MAFEVSFADDCGNPCLPLWVRPCWPSTSGPPSATRDPPPCVRRTGLTRQAKETPGDHRVRRREPTRAYRRDRLWAHRPGRSPASHPEVASGAPGRGLRPQPDCGGGCGASVRRAGIHRQRRAAQGRYRGGGDRLPRLLPLPTRYGRPERGQARSDGKAVGGNLGRRRGAGRPGCRRICGCRPAP